MIDQPRPNPDTLLAQVNEEEAREKRGKLKVFLGAAPGVGKTFAMLEEARKRAAEGFDVLVGYAEQHIRPETEAMLLGMDILPYKLIEYRGATLREFDLDAALARRPQLILIDELAHTNAAGLRHQKRWQDVGELLGAGIDVYSTLNVQHLESLNDVVERITTISVRETLPDVVLDTADEVELVDTSPEELMERLREGKIYRPDIAERAMHGFFNKGNLIALRELALRKTAERVDAQMQDFRRDHSVKTTWAATERILVCVSSSPLSARLVRAARRLASGLKAPWIAAYVETPGAASRPQQDLDRTAQTLRLAQQLGADTVTLSGRNVAEELIAYAATRNITKIIIGKPEQSRWREMLRRSVVDDVIRHSGQIDIYVIRGGTDEPAPPPTMGPRDSVNWKDYAKAVGVVAAATLVAWPMHRSFALSNIIMVYLLAVVAIATRVGRGPAVSASILSVAAFDFFFVPPRWTFAVSDTQFLVTFAVMLIVALVISTLTDRVRQQAIAARDRERRTAALFSLSRELAAIRQLDDLLAASTRQIAEVFDSQCVILLPNDQQRLVVREKRATSFAVDDDKELGVAQWSFDHRQPAGMGTATLPSAKGLYLPLVGSHATIGVLGICPADPSTLRNPEQLRLLETFASQSALVLERANLAEQARSAWERVETEFMRNTLLSSVSHDLRTPLAAIIGAASSLTESNSTLTDDSRRELADSICQESERMDRLINNLLDMTRLESGGLLLKKEWQPLQEVVGSSLHHLAKRLGAREVITRIASDLSLVPIDAIAIEQVLVNLLDNAIQYTPVTSPIEISAIAGENQVIVHIRDHGPGVPAGKEEQIFQKFFRSHPHNSMQSGGGIGLGLAICRGIVEAHGGTITASNCPEGGADFRFTLPLSGTPPSLCPPE